MKSFLSKILGVLCFIVFSGPAQALPAAGTRAPAFTLKGQDGKEVSLEQFKGKWVVLYFYPKDFTSGCSLQAHNFQVDLPKYRELNAEIVGISVDSVDSHQNFCARQGLGFKLLSDEEHTVSKLYDSFAGAMGVGVSRRNTFLIDPEGVIRKVYENVNPGSHSKDVLTDLASKD